MHMLSALLMLLSSILVTATGLDSQVSSKRNFTCPSNFTRLGHKCYFFSDTKATWQDAYYQCNSMRSNLAVIRNRNQDKVIRKTLSRKSFEPVERWVGGRFDWHRRQWKWAASGKPLTYKSFDKSVIDRDEEALQWHCILIDPVLEFHWSTRSCLEEKHFVCQKTPDNKTPRKKNSKAKMRINNEVFISDSTNRKLKRSKLVGIKRLRRNRLKEEDIAHNQVALHYKVYKEGGSRQHPLYPRPIVEEYNFVKSS